MDLTQKKLSKFEWESIEIPENEKEQKILKMIMDGYTDLNISINQTTTVLSFLKINTDLLSPEYQNFIEVYIFENYFIKYIKKLKAFFKETDEEYRFLDSINPKTKMKLKRADEIRFQKSEIKSDHLEFLLLNELVNFLDTKNEIHYFTIFKLSKNRMKVNKYVNDIISYFLHSKEVDIKNIVYQSNTFIEKNEILSKYSDITLYDHQKQIFNYSQNQNPKLIFYIAPTGTGKTLTPIALSQNYRIIFVCAARHVGLSFAKACITMGKKIAFAFGCETTGDIRLHYSAAKKYTKDTRSGGIFKVDNSLGEKVEIIISDIQSYLPSMNYMIAFNSPDKIMTYWDEPTITLDCDEHPLHKIIQQNWCENLIPNIVLSSATLPKPTEITETINDFRLRFSGDINTITSYDCKKTIPLVDHNGYIILPHLLSNDYNRIRESVAHCNEHLTLLRYFDLKQVSQFIQYIENNDYIPVKYRTERHFTTLDDVNVKNIKMHYLRVLNNIPEDAWETIRHANQPQLYVSSRENNDKPFGIFITTSDAYTLTDGPTIFLTENVEKIAQFYIQQTNIPKKIMDDIVKTIEYNNEINLKINEVEKKIEDIQNRNIDEGKPEPEKQKSDERIKGMSVCKQELASLQQRIKPVYLNNIFIPNKFEHINKWAKDMETKKCFTSNIEEVTIIRIMSLNVEYSWKVLLLIGIGVFATHNDPDYTEIMKQLATEQKLFLIIADSDYIYGTNYQFCHGYLSKDLLMTQDKTIQAMGRIGRNAMNSEYSIRFRKQEQIDTLFYPDLHRPEVENMRKLFQSPDDLCSICYIKRVRNIRLYNCEHVFCESCNLVWNHSCALCREPAL